MAKDTVELLNQLEWGGERQLHVIGVSLGGMIAQELVQPSAFKRTLYAIVLNPSLGLSNSSKNRLSHLDINSRTFSK